MERAVRSTAVAGTGAASFLKTLLRLLLLLPVIPFDAAGVERPAGETGGGLSAANLLRPPGGCGMQGIRRRRARKGARFSAYSFDAL